MRQSDPIAGGRRSAALGAALRTPAFRKPSGKATNPIKAKVTLAIGLRAVFATLFAAMPKIHRPAPVIPPTRDLPWYQGHEARARWVLKLNECRIPPKDFRGDFAARQFIRGWHAANDTLSRYAPEARAA